MKLLRVPFFKQSEIYTCGPASLEMIFALFGKHFPESSLKKLAKSNKKTGTSHQGLIDVVRKKGFYCYVHENSNINQIKAFIEQGFPIVIRYIEPKDNEDHYSVIVGYNKNYVFLNDPWNGRKFKVSSRDFVARWKDKDGNLSNDKWLMLISNKKFSLGRQYNPIK